MTDCVTFFNGFFPSPGAWDFRHIPAQWWAARACPPRSKKCPAAAASTKARPRSLFEGPEPGTLVQYFKDDATAFNDQKKGTITGKGVLNNRISEYPDDASSARSACRPISSAA